MHEPGYTLLMFFPCCNVLEETIEAGKCWMCGLHTGVPRYMVMERLPRSKWPPSSGHLSVMGFKGTPEYLKSCPHP